MRARSALLVLMALLLGAPAVADAQITLKGGANLADFFGDDVESSDPRPRLAAGGSFDVLSLGPVTVAPELYYAQKGADDLQTGLQQGTPVQVSLEYVEIPVLLRVGLPFGGARFSPYVSGGPVFGWQLDCSLESDVQAGVKDDCDQLLGGQDQLEETLRDHEQGLMFGAGFAFDVLPGFGGITLDARYSLGLTRLSEDDEGPDIQNRAFALLLGWRLGT